METRTTEMMDKRPIAKTLRGMEVGAVEYFPLSQFATVRNALYFSMRMEKARGWKFDIQPEDELMRVKVTRTQ